MSSSIAGSSTTTATNLSLDPFPSSEQLCYLQCSRCDTVLAVSVPSSSLFKTVTVRCGHCCHLLPVNTRSLLQPPSANQHHLPHHNFFSPTSQHHLGQMSNPAQNFTLTHQTGGGTSSYMTPTSSRGGPNELPRPPTSNRPPEKRQRVPSAYNRFIKDEIQRIKAENPDISHREAFSAAAKNWAHFPHIHFGMMPDQTVKRTSTMRPHHPQEAGENVRMKNGFLAAQANVGYSPY